MSCRFNICENEGSGYFCSVAEHGKRRVFRLSVLCTGCRLFYFLCHRTSCRFGMIMISFANSESIGCFAVRTECDNACLPIMSESADIRNDFGINHLISGAEHTFCSVCCLPVFGTSRCFCHRACYGTADGFCMIRIVPANTSSCGGLSVDTKCNRSVCPVMTDRADIGDSLCVADTRSVAEYGNSGIRSISGRCTR